MNNNTSYNNPKIDQKISVTDLISYLLSYWWWFAISIAICCTVAWFHCQRSPLIYHRAATVIIKDPGNKSYSAGLDRFDNYINRVNVANELLQFRTSSLMNEVVTRLDANVNYQIEEGYRNLEIYTSSPVKAEFKNIHPERQVAMTIIPKDSSYVIVKDIKGVGLDDTVYKLRLGSTLRLGDYADLVVTSTRRYSPEWYGKEIFITHRPVSDAVAYFQSNLMIRQAEDEASILTFGMQDNSAKRAEDVINTLIDVYNEEAINDKNRVAVNTGQFINDRLKIIESELGSVEGDLQQFKKSHGIVDIESTTDRFMSETERYDTQEIENQAHLQWAYYVKDYLVDPSAQDQPIPTHTGLAGMNLEGQIAAYNSLLIKRQRLGAESGSSNPVLEEMDDHLRSSRESIIRSVDNLIANLKQKRGIAATQKSKSMGKIADIPETQREMLSIERQQKIKETLYMFLLNKREENALTQAMADNNARMIDTPKGSRNAVFPRPKHTVILGFLIGFAIPALILITKLFLDTKVRSRKDLEGKVTLPILGDIPLDKKASGKSVDLTNTDDRDDILSEAFRILRTNLLFFNKPDHPVKVITLSSFNEGAGKTFIVSNLALSLTRAKKRVLIIDLDVRKGTLSRAIGADRTGVTNFLVDPDLTVDQIVQHFGNIDFISSGAVAPNPAELLMEHRLDELIDALKERYDYILVDNVPVGVVADATIANRIADLTVFVLRAGRFDRRQIQDIETLKEENKLNNMVLVINGADYKSRYGYYGYYGGYGYHGYKYYSYGKKK